MAAEIARAVILGAAPCENWAFLRFYLEQWKPYTLFCADGGVKSARSIGLTPDYLVGDWDSGGKPAEGIPCITLPVEKDWTDLEVAINHAMDMGARELLLCGCTGGRLDHTAANLLLLEHIAQRGGSGVIVDECNEVRLLDNSRLCMDNKPPYHYLSLIPLDRQITGVTLEGVKYPLRDAVLQRGLTLAVSNEPAAGQVRITTGSGRALLIRSVREDK